MEIPPNIPNIPVERGIDQNKEINPIIKPSVKQKGARLVKPGAINEVAQRAMRGVNQNKAARPGALHNKRVENKPPMKVQIKEEIEKVRIEKGEEIAAKALEYIDTHKRMEKPTEEGKGIPVEQFSAYLNKKKMTPPPWLMELDKGELIDIVWRGCSMHNLVGMIVNESASSYKKYDLNTQAPEEDKARGQVGEAVGDEQLPEFTREPLKARQFGTGNTVAVFAIPTKYLTRGSDAEFGVVCNRSAPAMLIGWEEGRPFERPLPIPKIPLR